jgi:hypothetical protein
MTSSTSVPNIFWCKPIKCCVFVHGFITRILQHAVHFVTYKLSLPNDFICLLTLKRIDLGEGKNWWPPLCIQVGGLLFGVVLVTEVKPEKKAHMKVLS